MSRRKGVRTTRRGGAARRAPDLIERDFTAERPDRLWVAGITYAPTWAGCLHLAVVLEAFSRRVVGRAMAPTTSESSSSSTPSIWRRGGAGRTR